MTAESENLDPNVPPEELILEENYDVDPATTFIDEIYPEVYPELFPKQKSDPVPEWSKKGASTTAETNPEIKLMLADFSLIDQTTIAEGSHVAEGTDDPPSPAPGPGRRIDKPTNVPEVASKYGLTYDEEVVNGQTVYHFRIGRIEGFGPEREPVAFSLTGTVEELDTQLAAILEQYADALEQKYNVKIGRTGQTYKIDGDDVPIVTPSFDQLEDIEKALQVSMPSLQTADGQPLSIIFTKEQLTPYPGWYEEHDDPPAVIIEPSGAWFMLDKLLAHELGHATEDRLSTPGVDHGVTVNAGGLTEAFYEALGYKKLVKTDENGNQVEEYILRTKDGAWYKPYGDLYGETYWILCDENGNPIHLDGRNESADVQFLSDEQMRERMIVKPVPYSTYITFPWEMGADALRDFRFDEQTRKKLLQTSPELYELAKQFDQADINLTYGVNEDGTPRYVRLPDGRIMPNNDITQAVIATWERKAATTPDPEPLPSPREPVHPRPDPHIDVN